MQQLQVQFPVFEANQVLTSSSLNEIFNYLDEQERLTRANLIGIGIVCGLESKLLTGAKTTISISKGCGVSSQGYLFVEPADIILAAYRDNYTLPADLDYPPFRISPTVQYPLWELFTDGVTNTTPLDNSVGFLDDKAVLLFLELKKSGLRNCSPNNCDGKGSEVTASLKHLLIKRDDLTAIIANANNQAASDPAALTLAAVNLPDIKLPRFDVPNSNPISSNDIYAAYINVFAIISLAKTTGSALSAAYTAFKPLLLDIYPADPFSNFSTAFAFLDQAPVSIDQVYFLQYYYDFFDDLLRAYDEFRNQAAALICGCCPPDGLFPRHLPLGLLRPELVKQPGVFRQEFMASSALGACKQQLSAARKLFQRLVEMTGQFTDNPSLPKLNRGAFYIRDPQIRVTPSKIGNMPLAERAIPYYYQETGSPPLYQLWSPEKTADNRANQNLGYRFDEYVPAAPPFVGEPLSYDLEPYNFLRIEGHLGKNYQSVLRTLLYLKSVNRLPIECIALRSGYYDATQSVDLSNQSAVFQDLETLYAALKAELLTTLVEGLIYLYNILIPNPTNLALLAVTNMTALPGGTPKNSVLQNLAPYYQYPASSVGAWFEKYLTNLDASPFIAVSPNAINPTVMASLYAELVSATGATANELPSAYYPHAIAIYYFTKLAETLPATLDVLNYADFENKFLDLQGVMRYLRSDQANPPVTDPNAQATKEDLIDHFDEVLFTCKLEPIKSAYGEYLSRIKTLRRKEFFSEFLLDHPGIQHKAGTPLGGTFIIVYHQQPPVLMWMVSNVNVAANLAPLAASLAVAPTVSNTIKAAVTANFSNIQGITAAINRISNNSSLALNPDIGLILGAVSGQIQSADVGTPAVNPSDPLAAIIATAVAGLVDGTVIADFYLPYRVSSDTVGVQCVLPKIPPHFSYKVSCPNADGFAPVNITATGGLPPYEIKIDAQDYAPLGGAFNLAGGAHTLTVRDAEYAESIIQTVTIAPPISFSVIKYTCNAAGTAYTATFAVTGGTPPYTVVNAADATVAPDGNSYTSRSINSGTSLTIEFTDSNQCGGKIVLNNTCKSPPNFSYKVGCPNADGFAPVTVTALGGLPPYQIKIDAQNYAPLGGALNLAGGAHTLTIRDAENTESIAQTVAIAPPISFGVVKYTCNAANTAYTATFAVTGGTPPYTVVNAADATAISGGNSYTSRSINSGTSLTVEIADSNKCGGKIVLNNTCKPPIT
jgi:hypothetical protein